MVAMPPEHAWPRGTMGGSRMTESMTLARQRSLEAPGSGDSCATGRHARAEGAGPPAAGAGARVYPTGAAPGRASGMAGEWSLSR
jgi:hypothetical protein